MCHQEDREDVLYCSSNTHSHTLQNNNIVVVIVIAQFNGIIGRTLGRAVATHGAGPAATCATAAGGTPEIALRC